MNDQEAEIERWRDSNARLRLEMENQATRAQRYFEVLDRVNDYFGECDHPVAVEVRDALGPVSRQVILDPCQNAPTVSAVG